MTLSLKSPPNGMSDVNPALWHAGDRHGRRTATGAMNVARLGVVRYRDAGSDTRAVSRLSGANPGSTAQHPLEAREQQPCADQ